MERGITLRGGFSNSAASPGSGDENGETSLESPEKNKGFVAKIPGL